MSALLALASPELCAVALRRPAPDGPEDAVRVILDGTAAMGLDALCGPWDHEAEVAAVVEELSGAPGSSAERLRQVDTVTEWLVGSPGGRPVVGVVSGPVWLGRATGDEDEQGALDIASDFVADRVRSLCELGVRHVVVLEAGEGDASAAAEAHTAVTRLARHFGVPVTLVALDDAVPAADLGYERWVTPSTGSGDLGLVTADALRDPSGPAPRAGSLVTDYLPPEVEPARVREVAASAGRG